MSSITLDPELRAKLNGMNEQMTVCDEAGKPLGVYLPMELYRKIVLANLEIPFTPEELDEFRKQGGGRPLAEIWKDLGRP